MGNWFAVTFSAFFLTGVKCPRSLCDDEYSGSNFEVTEVPGR